MARSMLIPGCCLTLLSLILTAGTAGADEGKDLFQARCASCHTVGGGDSVGPDLKGVGSRRSSDWLVRMITEPDRLSAGKDPTQVGLVKKYGMEMPKLGVSREDAQKIIAFLGGGSTAAPAAPSGTAVPAGPEEASPAAPPAVTVTPQLLDQGRALFTGKTPFAKGGAPCVSCHDLHYPGIHGGTLAANLTGIYASMGESGVRGVLGSLSFPVMKRVYADRPLTEAETAPLVALFEDAAARKTTETSPFPYSGLGFFALFIVAFIAIRRRIR
ncbi:cytochrome c [Geomonas sp. Red32]|uniref:c-type cytochrome n=1 Tax=Geomonas sp. Red32 TaxID=2912856 RepID=UPI00202CFFC6|nr:cytochrome c [Geomonas sp. Red32]MCM0080692.1 cytochrome c [Geomonas sp. Red32]